MRILFVMGAFIPIVGFALTSHLKGHADIIGLILVVGLSAFMLSMALYPKEFVAACERARARWLK